MKFFVSRRASHRQRAFTLIELLVVMTIIALLAVAALVDYGMSVKKARLQIATEQVVVTLEDAQVRAQTSQGEEVNCWGVSFDVDAIPKLHKIAWNEGCQVTISGFETVQTLGWNSHVTLDGLEAILYDPATQSESTHSANSLWMVYSPPDGRMSIYEKDGANIDLLFGVTQVNAGVLFDHSTEVPLSKTIQIFPATNSTIINAGWPPSSL